MNKIISNFKNLISWFLKKLRNRFYIEQWILLYSFNKNDIKQKKFTNFHKIFPPKDRIWADPFFIKENSSYYIFFEEKIFHDKGNIFCLEVFKDGSYTKPKLILSKSFHLSYPFIIKIKENFFMIPESIENKTIDIYKCDYFPYSWSKYKTIFNNINAVDPTIFFYNNTYWLFVNLKSKNSNSTWEELHLFYSDDLFSVSWTSHPLNPIINDIRYSRPAGNIFKLNNKIIRPSQNSKIHYGHNIELREIITLNKLNYEEVSYSSILPDWKNNIISTHTINSNDEFSVIDAQYLRYKF
tara:strand:- start:513 stop:1403 length:891 start_codon:yes stop_codon:yes gene_type:complete